MEICCGNMSNFDKYFPMEKFWTGTSIWNEVCFISFPLSFCLDFMLKHFVSVVGQLSCVFFHWMNVHCEGVELVQWCHSECGSSLLAASFSHWEQGRGRECMTVNCILDRREQGLPGILSVWPMQRLCGVMKPQFHLTKPGLLVRMTRGRVPSLGQTQQLSSDSQTITKNIFSGHYSQYKQHYIIPPTDPIWQLCYWHQQTPSWSCLEAVFCHGKT